MTEQEEYDALFNSVIDLITNAGWSVSAHSNARERTFEMTLRKGKHKMEWINVPAA